MFVTSLPFQIVAFMLLRGSIPLFFCHILAWAWISFCNFCWEILKKNFNGTNSIPHMRIMAVQCDWVAFCLIVNLLRLNPLRYVRHYVLICKGSAEIKVCSERFEFVGIWQYRKVKRSTIGRVFKTSDSLFAFLADYINRTYYIILWPPVSRIILQFSHTHTLKNYLLLTQIIKCYHTINHRIRITNTIDFLAVMFISSRNTYQVSWVCGRRKHERIYRVYSPADIMVVNKFAYILARISTVISLTM